MSTTAIPEDRMSSGHDVRFRIPQDVATAASAVAQRELISLSDVARRALVADLRRRGLLREADSRWLTEEGVTPRLNV